MLLPWPTRTLVEGRKEQPIRSNLKLMQIYFQLSNEVIEVDECLGIHARASTTLPVLPETVSLVAVVGPYQPHLRPLARRSYQQLSVLFPIFNAESLHEVMRHCVFPPPPRCKCSAREREGET